MNKVAITEDFFKLSICLAGEILQKFINYNTKLSIIGDSTCCSNNPLKDFIYRSNHDKNIFFVSTEENELKSWQIPDKLD
ncbi:DUF4180 domain-containing protein [Tissierella sp. MSJ-40]|uniref:DUF4180 domain-containing protein n=1 Tax=Tissierella simiarum TaxID=2841534 RepID=A0ABS6E442_9FIRM|nr:DUF4180 domain-containing protein [Tissierella simiarum]